MLKMAYILSSEESEILLAFETSTSLEKLSETLSKDVSNISRALNRMSEKLPVVEKQNNRWQLTDLGRRLNHHTRDSIQFQQGLLNNQTLLRIGTNREFSARVLGPKMNELQKLYPNTQLRLCAYEAGVENALLESQIDIGIDCERPFNPDVSYKLALAEDIIAVCSPQFKKNHQRMIKDDTFFSLPHLLCDRLYPDKILKKSENRINVYATFNDIATTRAACLQSLGWALLPSYTISSEIDEKKLVVIDSQSSGASNYGVWWLRNRKTIEPLALKMKDWLETIKL